MIQSKSRNSLRWNPRRVCRYEVRGQVEDGSGQRIDCEGVATQVQEGAIVLSLTADSPSGPRLPGSPFGHGPRFVAFRGQTFEGLPIVATAPALPDPKGWSATDGERVDYMLTGRARLQAGEPSSGEAIGTWRFGLANVLPPVAIDQRSGPSGWELDLNGRAIQIVRLAPRTVLQKALKSRDRIAVTCHATLIDDAMTFKVAAETVSDFCSLLTIASGTGANWVYAERIGPNGGMIERLHQSSITSPYNAALPLIPSVLRSDFIESTFRTFQESKKERQLTAIALAYGDVRTTGFLETRALQMLSHIEMIVDVDAKLRGTATVLPQKDFDRAVPSLIEGFRPVLKSIFPVLDDETVERMAQHVRGLNTTAFKSRLRSTIAALAAEKASDEIPMLIRTRNDLVHRGSFATKKPFREWQRIAFVLDCLVVGLLKYSGHTFDVRRVDGDEDDQYDEE